MSEPSARRRLAGAAAMVSMLALVFAAAAQPGVAGASVHERRAQSHGAQLQGARSHGARPHGVLIKLEKTKKYGEILVDGGGRALYLLIGAHDKPLECKGVCPAIWPPLLTQGKPRAGKGVEAKMLGTAKRGSSFQVTYDGYPLYRYAADDGPGQVNGEGIKSFGGTWYLLARSGRPVKGALASSASSIVKGSTASRRSGSGSRSGW